MSEGNEVKRLVLASGNAGKIRELSRLLSLIHIDVVGMDTYGVTSIEETGVTFLENARQKALHCVSQTDQWSLAEDAGLEVDALGGRPGVYSARYAGEGATDAENNAKLLAALQGVPDESRAAQFRCVMVLASPAGKMWTAEGVCRGRIVAAPRGDKGFGYDPLFAPQGYSRTFAQMSADEKNALSHRGKALASLVEIVKSIHQG